MLTTQTTPISRINDLTGANRKRRAPCGADASPTATPRSVEDMLREIAFVLHATRAVKKVRRAPASR